jgi:Domain of unknown function (DUF4124)
LEFFMTCLNRQRSIAFVVAGVALVGALTAAKAQTIYRIVGADGKVTFSDKPPASAEQGKVASTGVGAAAAGAAAGNLPFAPGGCQIPGNSLHGAGMLALRVGSCIPNEQRRSIQRKKRFHR